MLIVWEALGDYHGPPRFDTFVGYVVARFSRDVVTNSYRAYVTKALALAPQGKYLTADWSDIIGRSKRREPERTADEIVDDVVARIEGVR